MKVTVVAVSAPALGQLAAFRKEFGETCGEEGLDLKLFYVASANPALLLKGEEIGTEIASADIAVIDIMGASEAMQDLVRGSLERCRGQRIVIGNACRDLNRLGDFSMDLMQRMKKGGTAGENRTDKAADAKGAPGKSAGKMMHRMRRMALMMGSVAPFGMMKDMKNLFLLIDYWQQAEREDIFSFMYLLLRNYGGMKQLPKEKPCSMKYGIYLKNPETKACTESLRAYWKKTGYEKEKPLAALLFYGHSYPNDFLPVVRAVYRGLSEFANVLPIAFSQNEDKDLEKLEGYLTRNPCRVDAIVNFMPFRLGAGPMGGDANAAVSILKKVNAPYFKPFSLTKVEREEWTHETGVNAGEFLISILLPELDGGIGTFPAGVMAADAAFEGSELSRMVPIEERVEMLCRRVQKYIALRKKQNREKRVAVICYNYPPGEDNLFGGAFLDTFASVEKLLAALKAEGYRVETPDGSAGVSAEALKAYFAEGACNGPKWFEEAMPGQSVVLDGKRYPVRGVQCGAVFIGLQPCRVPEETDAEEGYHDRNLEPPGEYQAFYHWIAKEFGADAILHMGTHGTLEFLPGKDSGMMGDCWPDRLVGDIPHFYYYYMGNPSEAMTAKRRSHAALISYQPPAFQESGLYGRYQLLKETIAEYRDSLQAAPERSGDLLQSIEEQAALLFPAAKEGEDLRAGGLDALEAALYEYETSLIPNGLHVLGQGYSREEALRYADQVLAFSEEEAGEERRAALAQRAMENRETEGILSALQGAYLPVSPGGDVLKNADCFPAGNNLVQFDPRLVPTKTAFERGARIAQQTMERYKNETGSYPESTAVILWGLETSKTQGETIGQILYYLGIRMRQFEGSFDTRFEIIPTEELTRPRVDVVIHICGFFRDMYPNLVDHFNEIFKKLDALSERDGVSGFAKNTRRLYAGLLQKGYPEKQARELARSRIFGPKAGEYGTSLTERIRKGEWTQEKELAAAFTDSLSYVYSGTKKGVFIEGLLDLHYGQVELISQVRNNVEYELVDLDHYYEFYGGLAKAVEQARGKKAAMYVADTAGAAVRTMDAAASLEKGIRTRLLNPAWIEGMMRHDYHGVQQISRRFENVIGLAATTNGIESRTFSDLEKCYVEDEGLRERMQKSNRFAYLNLLNRLAEANNRGYWKATEQELAALQGAYLETESELEEGEH